MKNKTKEKPNNFKKYLLYFWSVFVLGILAVVFIFLLAGWGAFGEMPTFEELENPETNLATEVISADGKILGKYFLENSRQHQYYD